MEAVSSDIARLQRDHDLRGRIDAGGRGPGAIGSAFERSSEIRTYTQPYSTKNYLDVWRRFPARPAFRRFPISLRASGDLLNNFRLIWVIQPPEQKYSAFPHPQISGFFRTVPSRQEGRIAIVTNARRDAVDARASARKVAAG
jgi:hypothetical protein